MSARIILVGQNSVTRRLLEARLRAETYDVALATDSAESALNFVRTHASDAVLIDGEMQTDPILGDAFSTCRTFRRNLNLQSLLLYKENELTLGDRTKARWAEANAICGGPMMQTEVMDLVGALLSSPRNIQWMPLSLIEGLEGALLNGLPSLSPYPRRFFCSYSSKDIERVVPRVKMLRNLGIPIWAAFSHLKAGDDWSFEIHKALKFSFGTIAFLSADALESDFVKKEVRLTGIHQQPLVPVRIDATPIGRIESALQINHLSQTADWLD